MPCSFHYVEGVDVDPNTSLTDEELLMVEALVRGAVLANRLHTGMPLYDAWVKLNRVTDKSFKSEIEKLKNES